MKSKGKAGRTSMFGDKAEGLRIQGVLSRAGGVVFEHARIDLARIYEDATGTPWKSKVSDADVVEFLALGDELAEAYFRQQAKRQQ